MTLFMFALAGFPPTAGFAGKFYIFSAAVQGLLQPGAHRGAHQCGLCGLLCACRHHDVYARARRRAARAACGPTTVALLALTAFGTLYLGVLPGGVLRLAEQSVQFLFQGL